jgi:hypothetical protein
LRIFLVSTFPTSDCRRVNVNQLLWHFVWGKLWCFEKG